MSLFLPPLITFETEPAHAQASYHSSALTVLLP